MNPIKHGCVQSLKMKKLGLVILKSFISYLFIIFIEPCESGEVSGVAWGAGESCVSTEARIN